MVLTRCGPGSTCPKGTACTGESGLCLPKLDPAGECPRGYAARPGLGCLPVLLPCVAAVQCPHSGACIDGFCIIPCSADEGSWCPPGFTCQASRLRCVLPRACKGNQDCPAKEGCSARHKRCYPRCTGKCEGGGWCAKEEGLCYPRRIPCRADKFCPRPLRCSPSRGECEAICGDGRSCPEMQECHVKERLCQDVPLACKRDRDCVPGGGCFKMDKRCYLRCSGDSSCPEGTSCDEGFCR